jgi:hypothetical protein
LEAEANLRTAFAYKRGYIAPILPTLKTSAQEISIFTTFPRCSLPIPNSFSIATINLDHAYFWDPLSNSFLDKQYTASLYSTSKSIYTTSSRNRLALLYNKAARIFKHNDQSISAIVPAQHQGDDSIARAQGKIGEDTRNEPV